MTVQQMNVTFGGPYPKLISRKKQGLPKPRPVCSEFSQPLQKRTEVPPSLSLRGLVNGACGVGVGKDYFKLNSALEVTLGFVCRLSPTEFVVQLELFLT